MRAPAQHYEVLGVSPDAPQDRIKQAYHAAVLALHPDKVAAQHTHGQDGASAIRPSSELFARAQQAYEVRCLCPHCIPCSTATSGQDVVAAC